MKTLYIVGGEDELSGVWGVFDTKKQAETYFDNLEDDLQGSSCIYERELNREYTDEEYWK